MRIKGCFYQRDYLMVKRKDINIHSIVNIISNKYEVLNKKLAQKTFSTNDRILLYEDLAFLLDNNTSIEKSLCSMRDTLLASKGRVSATVYCLNDAINALNKGQSLDIGLANWIPQNEVAMLSAAIKEEQLSPSLKRAVTMVHAMDKIKSALWEKLSQPLFLLISLIALATMLSWSFLPKMEMLTPRDEWVGAMEWLAFFSDAVGQHLILIGIASALIVAWITWSLPNMTGKIRYKILDHIPPWSLYRQIQGVSFLLSYSALTRANVKTEDAIIILSYNASPWLFERLWSTRKLLKRGRTLGQSLKESGYDFPSKSSIDRLILLTSGGNAETKIENHAHNQLKKTLSSIGYLAGRVQLFLYLLCGLYMGLVAFATQNISGAS